MFYIFLQQKLTLPRILLSDLSQSLLQKNLRKWYGTSVFQSLMGFSSDVLVECFQRSLWLTLFKYCYINTVNEKML